MRTRRVGRGAVDLTHPIRLTLPDVCNAHDHTARYNQAGLEPADLILKLVTVYLQVAGVKGDPPPAELHAPFLQAIARDGRSFRPDVFRDAARVVKSKYPARHDAAEMMVAFDALVTRFEDQLAEDTAVDADLGEVPDDFLCPIMSTLMEDPVRLPTSGQVIDRSTIRAHLLSNPRDPFNRAPLRIEDVVPDDELRERIQAFVRERRGAAAATAAAAREAAEGGADSGGGAAAAPMEE
jgi:ubiquitin conjugation factor E4 B